MTFGKDNKGHAVAGLEAPDLPFGEGIAVDAYGRVLVAGMTQDPVDHTTLDVLVARFWP